MCRCLQSFAAWVAVEPQLFGHLFSQQRLQDQFAMVAQLLSVVAMLALGYRFVGWEEEILAVFLELVGHCCYLGLPQAQAAWELPLHAQLQ